MDNNLLAALAGLATAAVGIALPGVGGAALSIIGGWFLGYYGAQWLIERTNK